MRREVPVTNYKWIICRSGREKSPKKLTDPTDHNLFRAIVKGMQYVTAQSVNPM